VRPNQSYILERPEGFSNDVQAFQKSRLRADRRQALAMHRQQHACSANEIAEEYGISATLMAKVLAETRASFLVFANTASSGGYQLAKDPSQIARWT